jgi:phosphoenolpyruvate synthase/pyruvate phosphate dikinase
MEFLRDFKKINKNDINIAGGKGASLGEMTKIGIPVPAGFVVLSFAFERFLEETDLNIEIDSILHSVNHKKIHTIENASEKITALILKAKIPQDISKEIKKYFKKLNSKYVAVRSSATSEDALDAAWAGQLESYLNTTEKNLLENIKKCWASLFTPRAIFYRLEKGLHNKKISVAVVVQKMIQSEKSGIAFSVHPVTQDKNQLIIEAGFGLGEAIVSGEITPDSYVAEKQPRRIIDKNIQTQIKGLYKVENGGNEWKGIPESIGSKQVLSDKEILKLSEIILKIENHYGFPCDIEWAFEKNKFYIIQSRPITTFATNQEIQKKSIDYIRMFESSGMPFLITSISLGYYKNLEVIAIFKNNLWTTFLPKLKQKITLKNGLRLFGNKNSFNKYVYDFNEYKKNSIKFFEKIISKKNILKKDLKNFFDLISKFWFFYSKTEFFYTDNAYIKSQNNKIIAKNLKKLEKIKNYGRKHMNKMIFGKSSYLIKVLSIISKQFNISINNLLWMSKNEILDLYDENKINISKIKQRKNAYVFFIQNKTLLNFEGKKAKNFISSFVVKDLKNINIIKGTTANSGRVMGKAKILFYGADNFDKVSKLIKKMKNRDILVTETTSPEIMPACKKAAAILTNQGGLLSHAAIVSRELKIPCIVGLENITKIVKDGDILEVDANDGVVKILKRNKK